MQDSSHFCLLMNLRYFLMRYGLCVPIETIGLYLGFTGFFIADDMTADGDIIHGRNCDTHSLFLRFQRIIAPNILPVCENDYQDPLLWDKHKQSLVWLNQRYLPYSPNHLVSDCDTLAVFVARYDDVVTIYDYGLRDLMLEDFIKSLNYNCEPLVMRYVCDKINFAMDKSQMIINGIRYLYNCKQNQMNRIQKGVYGPEGMMLLRNRLNEIRDGHVLYNIYLQMSRPGGVIKTRETIQKAFKTLYEESGIDTSQTAGVTYGDLASEWLMIANLIFRLSADYDRELRKRIQVRIDNIIEKEGNAMNVLKAVEEVYIRNLVV